MTSYKLSILLTFLPALVLQSGAQVQRVLDVDKGLVKEASTIVDEALCSTLKKTLGVNYEQLWNRNELDLSDLSLVLTSRNLNETYKLSAAPQLLSEAQEYDVQAPLFFFVHGFIDSVSKDYSRIISEALLEKGEYNILTLDWGSSSINWQYEVEGGCSYSYVQIIGTQLGKVLVALINKGQKQRSVHLAGHSLGAHVSGFMAKQVELSTNTKVNRITAMNPAGPCFTDCEPRLEKTDAEFVDVIHTESNIYGTDEDIGHADFYPNGGYKQPNCLLAKCSHLRAIELFVESIVNPQAFPARECASYEAFKEGECTENRSVMGYHCQPTARGAYYLRTGHSSPYSLGEGGARWKNDEGILGSIGNVGSEISGTD